MKSLSHVRLLATPRTVAYEAPPAMGFPRQEYWSGVPLPSLDESLVHLYFFHVLVQVQDCFFSKYFVSDYNINIISTMFAVKNLIKQKNPRKERKITIVSPVRDNTANILL